MAPSGPAEPTGPHIPGCLVTCTDDGLYQVVHTLTADTLERVEIAGAILRITANWSYPKSSDIRFTVGDLP